MANGTLKVENIQTSSGSGTITLGQSGETIAFGSGVTSKMNQPAFSAYLSSSQSPSNATFTKIQFDTEVFDTDNCYDNSTNYRFTPTVAGKYQVEAACRISGTSPSIAVWAIFKNGVSVTELNVNSSPAQFDSRVVANVIDMNGTTDYLEIFGYISASSSQTFNAASNTTFFTAYRIGVE